MGIIEGIKNFWRNSTVGIKVVVIGGVIGIVAIMIISAVVLLTPKPVEDSHVEVENFDDITAVPEDYQVDIQKLMWQAIEVNSALDGIVFTDAQIREGSYKEVVNDKTVSAKFIIDVPSMKYSFAVSASWSEGNTEVDDKSIKVGCPYYLDVIYTDTKCIAESPIEQVERYLPHYDYVGGDRLVSVEKRKYDIFQEHASEPYLAVSVKACADAGLMNAARDATVQWLKSRFLDPNDYYMEVIDTCR